MRRNKGITLIALVITIVVLIILAGVAISLSLGENGIFNRAEQAKEDYKVKANEEQLAISQYSNEMNTHIASNREEKVEPLEFESGPCQLGTGAGTRLTDVDFVKLKGLKKYKKLTITCNGNMGTYISARIYIDSNLVLTISDALEHTIDINNNDELIVNFYSYNGLSNGAASVKIKAE